MASEVQSLDKRSKAKQTQGWGNSRPSRPLQTRFSSRKRFAAVRHAQEPLATTEFALSPAILWYTINLELHTSGFPPLLLDNVPHLLRVIIQSAEMQQND